MGKQSSRCFGIRYDRNYDQISNFKIRLSVGIILLMMMPFIYAFAEEAVLSLEQAEIQLIKGKSIQLNATVSGTDERSLLKWESSDQSVATVSNKGKVTAKSAGNAVIICETTLENGTVLKAQCVVEVLIPVTGIKAEQKMITVGLGQESDAVILTVMPDNASDKTVSWSSEDESIAIVEQTGIIRGMKTGKTSILATSNDGSGKKEKINVEVIIPVEKITLDLPDRTILKGKKVSISAEVLPESASNKKVVWSSSDSTIATVSNGTVTGKKGGSVTITAESADASGTKASIDLTVTEPVTSIKIDAPKELYEGQSQQLTVLVSPESATNKAVIWESSDPDVAYVDHENVLFAMKEGQTTLCVNATDGSGKKAEFQVTIEPINAVTIEAAQDYFGNFNPIFRNNSSKPVKDIYLWFTSYDANGEKIYDGMYDFENTPIAPHKSTDNAYAPLVNRNRIVYYECSVMRITFLDKTTLNIPSDKAIQFTFGSMPASLLQERIQKAAEASDNTSPIGVWRTSGMTLSLSENGLGTIILSNGVDYSLVWNMNGEIVEMNQPGVGSAQTIFCEIYGEAMKVVIGNNTYLLYKVQDSSIE